MIGTLDAAFPRQSLVRITQIDAPSIEINGRSQVRSSNAPARPAVASVKLNEELNMRHHGRVEQALCLWLGEVMLLR